MPSFLWKALALLALVVNAPSTSPAPPAAAPTSWRVAALGNLDEPREADFNPNYLLSDDELVDKDAISITQIDALLRETPFHESAARGASCLAGYRDEGISAAQALADASAYHGINPLVLLARIQTEASLLAKAECSDQALRAASGYACPDDEPCDVRYVGLRQQIWHGAKALRSYLTELEQAGRTRTGWEAGRTKRTKDGAYITPQNRATAALYTYTPWVGTRDAVDPSTQKARKRPFGTFLFWLSWAKLAGSTLAPSPPAIALGGGWVWPLPAHAARLPGLTARRWATTPARATPIALLPPAPADE